MTTDCYCTGLADLEHLLEETEKKARKGLPVADLLREAASSMRALHVEHLRVHHGLVVTEEESLA